MKISIIALLLGTLLMAGCNAVNRTQYQVTAPAVPEGVRAQAAPVDTAAVLTALRNVATACRLDDMTDLVVGRQVLVYYQQPETSSPIKLYAWTQDNQVYIDLMQGPSTPGTTLAYQRAVEILNRELRNALGNQVRVIPFSRVINPVSTAGR